jgi:ADP-heptose:LPS heptosyltransferase
LPAVRRLRLGRPDVVIGWAVEEWVYPVLEGNPNVDRFHVLNRRALRTGPRGAVTESWRFIRDVREQGYDTALDFHGRLKSGTVSWLSGAARRIGYAAGDCTEGNQLFNNVHVKLEDRAENRVLRFLHLLAPLGIEATFDPGDTGVHLDPRRRDAARAWYAERGCPAVAVYPGTSRNQADYHRWPAEKWVDLLRRLAGEGIVTVVFWGPDEADLARWIAERVPERCLLAPPTALTEMMAMLACFPAFVGSNTAAMHMAWLQGVPVAVFTGPAEPRTDVPLDPVPFRALRADGKVRAGISKRRQAEVVASVPVDEVFGAVTALLEEGRARQAAAAAGDRAKG